MSNKNKVGFSAKQSDRQVLMHRTEMVYAGPIPPAAELKCLNEVLPGAAERVIAMAEREQAARISRQEKELELESQKVSNDTLLINASNSKTALALWLSFATVIGILFITLYGFYKGHGWGSGIFGSFGLGFIVLAYTAGARIKNKNISSDLPDSSEGAPQ